jgi:hypothetical protein
MSEHDRRGRGRAGGGHGRADGRSRAAELTGAGRPVAGATGAAGEPRHEDAGGDLERRGADATP